MEIIRCKDCKYLSCTTIGMPYACWKDYITIDTTTGENIGHTIARRIDNIDHYCGYAEKR